MLKKMFAMLLCAAPVTLMAQEPADKFAATITKEDLKKQLTVIAGPEMEGRETGTEGQRKAAAYIAAQFKSIGLLPAPGTDNYQQYYAVGYDSLLNSTFSFGNKALFSGKDYVDETAINNSAKVTAKEIVFVGYGIQDAKYNDFEKKNVKGKVVIFFTGEPKVDGNYLISGTKVLSPWGSGRGLPEKLAAARKNGAVAAIVVNTGMDSISTAYARISKKTNMRLSKTGSESINAITIPGGLAASLFGDDFAKRLLTVAKLNALLNTELWSAREKVSYEFNEQKFNVNASNVAGYIEGTDKKDEYVVLTGHYDHLGIRNGKIYFGADDDGSGTCAVIEMAEAFAKAKAEGNGPRRTIVFMTVSGEEKGLWGSEYYGDHPLFPLEKTSVNLNTDMVGRIDPKRTQGDSMNYVYVIGDDKLSTELKTVSESVNQKYSKLELDYKYNDPKDPERIYYRSDHYNFARKGVPIIFYFNGTHKDYHQPTDTVEKIVWDLYEKRVRFVFYTAWEMANREGMMKRDIPLN
ncbi:MAG: M28 family peptidase [Gemmatimonadaceae bacterium]|nr:M28 family peptidase [Chitinophagaceae bacterium]